MFGGKGVYADGLMFAMEMDGQVYLKCDAETETLCEQAGSTAVHLSIALGADEGELLPPFRRRFRRRRRTQTMERPGDGGGAPRRRGESRQRQGGQSEAPGGEREDRAKKLSARLSWGNFMVEPGIPANSAVRVIPLKGKAA